MREAGVSLLLVAGSYYSISWDVFSKTKQTAASQGSPAGERKEIDLLARSHSPRPASRKPTLWVINFPGKTCFSLSRRLGEAKVGIHHGFWPPVTFEPFLYMEDAPVSESLLSKEVRTSLDVLGLRMGVLQVLPVRSTPGDLHAEGSEAPHRCHPDR